MALHPNPGSCRVAGGRVAGRARALTTSRFLPDLLNLLAAFTTPSCAPGGGGAAGGDCTPADITQIIATGAGAPEWNGVYERQIDDRHPADGIAFMKDDTHEIYKWNNVWRFADYGVATYYVAAVDGPYDNKLPPAVATDWTVTAGIAPPPKLTLGCGAAVGTGAEDGLEVGIATADLSGVSIKIAGTYTDPVK